MPDDTLFSFPCRFTLKVMAVDQDHLFDEVLGIVRQHAPQTSDSDIAIRHSKAGNYISLTITVHATHRTQLDQLYHDLVAHKSVKVVL